MSSQRTSGKSGSIDLDKYCNSLLEANFYKLQQSEISQRELFKSVAAYVYQTDKCNKKKIKALANKCKLFYANNKDQINLFFKTNYNGQTFNFQTTFQLSYEFNEIFSEKKTVFIIILKNITKSGDKTRLKLNQCCLAIPRISLKKVSTLLLMKMLYFLRNLFWQDEKACTF